MILHFRYLNFYYIKVTVLPLKDTSELTSMVLKIIEYRKKAVI